MTKKVYLLLGPSGSGKTTAARYLQENGFHELVSHTSRKPREGEVHGKDYYFTTVDEIKKMEKIEEACYAGNHYSLSLEEFNTFKSSSVENSFVIVDIHGVQQMQDNLKTEDVEVLVVFFSVTLPSMVERMLERGDTRDNIVQRVNNAIKNRELENVKHADIVIPETRTIKGMQTQIDRRVLKE